MFLFGRKIVFLYCSFHQILPQNGKLLFLIFLMARYFHFRSYHPHLQSCCLIIFLRQMIAHTYHCFSLVLNIGVHPCHA